MQTFILHSTCFSNVCHAGSHAVDDFEIAFDYTQGWDLLIWDLKGRVSFESLSNNVYNFMFGYRF